METEKITGDCQANTESETERTRKRWFRVRGFGIVSFSVQLVIGLAIIMPNIIIFRHTGWAYITIKTGKDRFAHTYRIKTTRELIDRLDDVRNAGEKIVFFEYVGRGSERILTLKGSGLSIGNGGIYTRLMIPNARGIPGKVFILEDIKQLIREVFDPEATIELEACYTAYNSRSITYAFKRILPKAHVWGYTWRAHPVPITGFHETFRSRGSKWVEAKGEISPKGNVI